MNQRQEILTAITEFLHPLPAVNALWQGGAAAWKRVDEWSDIDVVADVADEQVENIMQEIERFLDYTFGLDSKLDITGSLWPHLRQTFFRLKNTSPFLLIDCCLIPHSSHDKFLETEIHGTPIVHFDKQNIVQPVVVNQAQLQEKLRGRIAFLRQRFELFQVLVEKELNRGNSLEAFSFYMAFTLQPLIEMLRLVYAPHHHSFGTRYIQYDLPGQVVERLQPLYFIPDAAAMRNTWKQAGQLFNDTVAIAEKQYQR